MLPEDQLAKVGQQYVMFNCSANGNPKPHISWFFNMKRILLSDRMSIHSNGSIKIESIEEGDGGSYMCQAENIHGIIKSSVDLGIFGNSLTYNSYTRNVSK